MKSLVIPLLFIALGFASSRTAIAQTAPPPPQSVPVLADGDQEYWLLWNDMTWEIGNSGIKLVVPAGFVTDFASIPKFLWSTGLTPTGRYGRAAIIHDFLYWSQGCTKAQADRLMVIAMKESQVDVIDEKLIYSGVSVGGDKSWKDNEEMRKRKILRVVPSEYRTFEANRRWLEYREILMTKGVYDPVFEKSPNYCQLGDSFDVPGSVMKTAEKKNTIIRLPGNKTALQTGI